MDVSDRRKQKLLPISFLSEQFSRLWGVSTVIFLKKPKKTKRKKPPHVEYNYINTTRKKTRR